MPLSVSRTRMTRRTSGRLVLALDGVRLRGWIVVLWCGGQFPGLPDLPGAAQSLAPGPVFLGYSGLGVLAALFVKVFVAETKGRSLEEIEADLQTATGRKGRTRDLPQQAAVSR